MGVLIAVFHVLSAVVVIGATHWVVKGVTGQAPANYRIVKLISYAAIVVIGATMLWRAARGYGNRHTGTHVGESEDGHAHGHDHDSHEHHAEGCHACDALHKKKKGAADWLALAVGSVPCTGAVLVLLFGFANDLLGPAVMLVVCISCGMALAISGIGILSILGRNTVARRWREDPERLARFARGSRIAGASLILTIGVGLIFLTLYAGSPMSSPPPTVSQEERAQR